MDDFEIDILDKAEEASGRVRLPKNILSVGELERDDLRVYIKQDVYKALEDYARVDISNERGTMLIGDYREDNGVISVIISDYIEGRYAEASASTLTFTHETWDYVHKTREEKFPKKKIVGWQHTHPSYGIFLSNYDLFIHENFFDLPFQTAYVIDPIQNKRGFFRWKSGRIEKLKGYYVYDDIGKPIRIGQGSGKKKSSEAPPEPTERKKGGKLITAALILALLLAIGSLLTCFQLTYELNRRDEEIDRLKRELYSQDAGKEHNTSVGHEGRIRNCLVRS